jgi:hypothetical protein
MTEQGESGAVDCCPIFSTIVESLENMWYTDLVNKKKYLIKSIFVILGVVICRVLKEKLY